MSNREKEGILCVRECPECGGEMLADTDDTVCIECIHEGFP